MFDSDQSRPILRFLRRPTRGIAVETALVVALTLLAAAIRLPYFELIPRYTDEVREVAPALAIAFAGERPLVQPDAYRGAHWTYLLAAALRLTGPTPALPRLFALCLGTLTVAATYALGRVLCGRRTGIVAALLIATAFSHVALNSHVAWTNNSTPLWTTLAAGLTYLGVRRSRAAFVLAGLVWGMALSTHPSVLLPLVGMVVWLLRDSQARSQLRTAAPWLSLLAMVITVSPLLYYNMAHRWPGVADALRRPQPVERSLTPRQYAANLLALTGQLGRMAGAGPQPERGDPVPSALVATMDRLRPLATAIYAFVLVSALTLAAWRGPRLPALMGLAGILLMPTVNRSYVNFYDTRYLAFVLPLAYVALAGALCPQLSSTAPRRRLAVGLLLAFLVYPCLTLAAYYQREIAAGRTNAPLIAAADLAAQASRQPHSFVWVDKAMRPLKLGGGGDPTGAFDLLLALRQARHELADVDEMRWFLQADPATDFWLIAAEATLSQLGHQFKLQTVAPGPGWALAVRRAR